MLLISQLEVDEIGTLVNWSPDILVGELSLVNLSTDELYNIEWSEGDNINELTFLQVVVGPCLSITDVSAVVEVGGDEVL